MDRIKRLFIIKTRFEAFAVTYAIALGAVERGIHYMAQYPGFGGWLLFLACMGVPMIAGAKLLDSVRPQPQPVPVRVAAPRRRAATRSRPRSRPTRSGSGLALSLRRD